MRKGGGGGVRAQAGVATVSFHLVGQSSAVHTAGGDWVGAALLLAAFLPPPCASDAVLRTCPTPRPKRSPP
jgi:hypothetical protein